jgi:short-subunit dehydrogenase
VTLNGRGDNSVGVAGDAPPAAGKLRIELAAATLQIHAARLRMKGFAVNVGGNLNVVLPAIEIFRARSKDDHPHRQILITASIAGYGPLASCPSYSGTKAAMKTWALALRGMLKKEGIMVSAICPGFIRSRITDRNTCPMPFFMEADKAARIILARADRNVGMIAFPWPMRLATWWLSTLPFRLNEFINSLLPEKTAKSTPTPF